jgi:ribose 5-phosphate isomerase B
MKIAVGSDHAGFKGKQAVVDYLRSRNHVVEDVGTHTEDSVDYPDYARPVAERVARGTSDLGVLLCGTGIGMCIAANKVPGVRAAVVWSSETARLAAAHNKANVLCLSGRFFEASDLVRMIQVWLDTPFGEIRHLLRVRKIEAMDEG